MRVYLIQSVWFRAGNKVDAEGFCLADQHFFEFFSFPLLRGDAKTVLTDPFTAVISESMAERFFEQEDPIGSLITIDSKEYRGDYRVTGVMKDVPAQSTL